MFNQSVKEKMMSKTKRSIEQFLENANERNLKVRGNAEELWLVIDGIRLDHRFNMAQTPLMVRFIEGSNDPTILIPEEVSLKPDADISGTFIEPSDCIKGWSSVFPGLFLDVDGEIIELIFSIAGAIGNLSLYNLVSPESIETANSNEIIAEFDNKNETDNN